MKQNQIIIAAVALSLILSVVAVSKPAQRIVEQVVGAAAGPFHTEREMFASGISYGGRVATSTTAAVVPLLIGDLRDKSVIDVTLNVQDASITFPASTTLASMLPNIGDSARYLIRNATTTATMDLTIAASTGVLLKNATTTEIIVGDTDGANYAEVILTKKANSDYEALIVGIFLDP